MKKDFSSTKISFNSIGLLLCFLVSTIGLNAQITENFQSPGSYTWVCPTNVNSITVQCWGGGGGGGNSANTTLNGGHGGGGGAFSQSNFPVVPGQTYFIFVGSGGSGAPAYSLSSAIDGLDSWFNDQNNIPSNDADGVLAKGGKKGNNNTLFNIVNGGESSLGFGSIKFAGGNGLGGYSTPSSSGGQGGGSSAGINSNGTNASSIAGAIAPFGGGDGGSGSAFSTTNGSNGLSPGGGGGGSDDTPARKGGNGSVGQVSIIYTTNCSGIQIFATISATPMSGCGSTILVANGLDNSPGFINQWQSSINNSAWVDIVGANSNSYTANSQSSIYYRMKSTCSFGGEFYSNNIFYNFTGNPAQPAPNATATIIQCGQTANLTANGGGTSNYSWFSDPNGLNQVGTGNTFITPNLNAPTSYYVASTYVPQLQQTYLIPVADLVNLTFDCGTGSIYGSDVVGFDWIDILPTNVNISSVTAELSIGTECTAGSKTTTLNDASQSSFTTVANCSCNGNSLQTLNLSPNDYIKNDINQFRITNASSFGFNSSNTQFSGYFAKITVSYTISSPCYSNKTQVPITIVASSSAGVVTSNQTICSGSTPTTLSFTGITGLIQWQSSSDSLSWVNIAGANSNSLTALQIGSLTATKFYRVVITNNGCSDAFSNVVKILVKSLPIVNAGIDQIACVGSQVTLIGSGAQSYSWNNGVVNSIPFVVNTTTTFTVTGTDINNCQNTDQVTITATPQSIGGNATSNQSFCSSGTPVALNLAGYLGNIQWQTSTNNITWSNISGTTSPTLSAAQMGLLTSTKYFRALVTNGICSSATSNTIIITINPTSVGGTAGLSQIICEGTSASPITLTGNTGTIQWYSSSATTGPWTQITGATSSILSSAQIGILNSTKYYRATVVSGNCPSSNSNAVGINVTPASVGGSILSSQSTCSGISVNLTLSGYTGSIQWKSSTDNLNFSNIAGAVNPTLNTGGLSQTNYYVASVTNGICASSNSSVATVTVSPTSVAGSITSSQTICSGTSPLPLTLSGNVGTIQWQSSTNNSTWTNISGATSAALSSAQMGTLTANKYFRVIVTSGVCSSVTSNVVLITVNIIPTVTSPVNQQLCNGSNTNLITFSGTGTTYNWTNSISSIGLAVSGIGNINSFVATNNTSSEIISNLSVTPVYTSNGTSCFGTSKNFTFTISPTSQSGTVSGNQSICTGTSPAALTLSGSVGTIQWQVSTNNTSWTNISGATTSTLTSAQMGTLTSQRFYRAILTSGVCPSATSNVVIITINALPIISAGVDQIICLGTPIILSGNGGLTYTWNNGITNNLSFSPTNTATYTVTGTDLNGCQNTDAVVVTVNSTSLIGTINSSQTICTGSSPSTKTLSGSYVGSLQWQFSNDNITWNNISGATSTSLTSAQMGALTSVRYYRLTATNGVCSPAISNVITVNISSASIAGTISSSQTICEGSFPDSLIITGNNGTIQWQSSNNSSTWTDISGANSSILTSIQMGSLVATKYYRAKVINSPCSTVYSNIVTITVNPLSNPGVLDPEVQDICIGSSAQALNNYSTNGSNFQWQSSSTQTGPWLNITNATSSTLSDTEIGTLIDTTYFQLICTSGVCPSVISSTATVNVLNLSTVGTVSSSQTICSGTTPANLQLSSFNGTIQWQISTLPSSGWSNISNTNSPVLTSAQIGNLTTTTYFRVSVKNGVCSEVFSNEIIITVNPIPTVTTPVNQSICANNSSTAVNFSGNGTSYDWTNSQPMIGLALSGTGNIPSFITSNPNTSNLVGNLSVTPTYSANGTTCIGTSKNFTFTIYPTSIAGTASSNQVICTGTLPSPLSLTGNVGTIQWQSSSNNITWTNTNVTTSTLSSAQMGTLTATKYYRALVTSANCASATSNVITITVSPATVAGTISTSQTSVCSGSNPSANFILSGNVGTIQWQINNNATGWNDIINATSNVLNGSQVGPISVPTSIRAIVVSQGCSSLTTNTIALSVVSNSIAGTLSSNQSICTGSSASALSISSSTGTIQWQSSTNGVSYSNISAATNNTFSPGILTSSAYYQVLVTNSICPSDTSNPILINVLTTPSVGSISQNQSICYGTSPSSLNHLGSYNGNLQWQWATSTSGPWTSISGATSSTLPSSSIGNLTSNRYFRLMVTNSPCSGTIYSNIILISILQLPTVNAGSDQNVCQGTYVTLSGNGAISFSWSNGISNNVAFPAINNATYTVTGTGSNGCSNTDQVIVNILPTPAVSINLGTQGVICSGQQFTLTSAVTNGLTYLWNLNNNVVGTSPNFSGNIGGVYTLTVINGSCSTTSAPLTVSTSSLPIIDAGQDQNICLGDAITLNATGTGTIQWSENVIDGVSFVPDTSKVYTVTATDELGCQGTDNMTVYVHYPTASQVYTSSIGSYFLNGTEYNQSGVYSQTIQNQWGCDSIITLNLTVHLANITENAGNQTIFYPNPSVDGIFYFKLDGTFQPTNCCIYNSLGQKIESFESIPLEFNLSEKEQGIYFIELSNSEFRYIIKAIKNGK